MKTTLTFVLVAFAGFGLAAHSQAVAQEATMPYDPAYAAEVIRPGSVAQQPNPAPGNFQAQAPGATAQPVAQNHATGGDPLIDNGLWEGAPAELGCSICGDGNCAPAEWYTEQDVRILNRSRAGRAVISTDYNESDAAYEILNTHSVTPDISAAYGLTIGHHFARDTRNNDHFVEFSFWGLNDWSDSATVYGHRMTDTTTSPDTTHGSLNSMYYYVPGGSSLLGFNNADMQRIEYTSATNNFEVNGRFTSRNRADRLVLDPSGRWRKECRPGMHMTYLYGVRYLQINEGFRFHSESEIDTLDDDDVVTSEKHYTGDYDISTHNNLIGLQVGAEMMFHKCRWAWGVRSKIGPYVNFSDQVSDITSGRALDPGYIRRIAGSKHTASLIGEVGFETTYKFRPNLVGRAGYDFMWVTGVATAPGQLQFQPEPVNTVNSGSLAFFQGVTLGLEWLW